jgi:hypothetical protein
LLVVFHNFLFCAPAIWDWQVSIRTCTYVFLFHIFNKKGSENTKQKGAKREKPNKAKPEAEQEGMPPHQQYSHAKRREDMNPTYHEEQHKDAA